MKCCIYSGSAKFGLSSNIVFICFKADRRKRRVPEYFIKSEVSVLPKGAFSLFSPQPQKHFNGHLELSNNVRWAIK
jgi:hypothetical protein